MKTHPVFYVGRLKRYIDPNKVKYPQSEETGDTMRRKAKDSLSTSDPYDDVVDLENEGHHASNADPSPKLSHGSPTDLSGVHTLSILQSDSLKLRGQSQDLTIESVTRCSTALKACE